MWYNSFHNTAHIAPREWRGRFYGAADGSAMGVSMQGASEHPFLFCLQEVSHHDTGLTRQYRPCARHGPPGHSRARLPGAGGRRHYRPLSRSARPSGGRGGPRFRRPHHHAVLRRYAPPRPPVPHAGHGNGPTAAGLAQHLHVPHGGAVRRPWTMPAASTAGWLQT